MSFPYLGSLAQLYKRLHIKAWIKRQPRFADFYLPDHPARGLQITTGIIEKFYQEAQARGKYPLTLIFPTLDDMYYYEKHRKWVYEPLLEQLRTRRINLTDIGQELIDYLGNRSPWTLFEGGNYHFNNEGNAAVAEIVYQQLKAKRIDTTDATFQ